MTAIINALTQFKSVGAQLTAEIIPGYTNRGVVIDQCEVTEAIRTRTIGNIDLIDKVLVTRHTGLVEDLRDMVNSTYQIAKKQGMATNLDSEAYLQAVKQRGYSEEVDSIFSTLSKEEGLKFGRITLLFDSRSATTVYEQDGGIATCAILLSSIVEDRSSAWRG